MTDTLKDLENLSAAEEFFSYLAVPFEPAVVHVSRLHILKRFNQYLRTSEPSITGLVEPKQYEACRVLLARAYEDFVRSTPALEKVFKVFQEGDGTQIALEDLRSTLASRNC